MDFDLDDPLGDLLSDGSNDSFFGTTKKPTETTKATAQTSSSDANAKAKVANLFGIDDASESVPKSNTDVSGKAVQSQVQATEPKKVLSKGETVNNPTPHRSSISSVKPSTPIKSTEPIQRSAAESSTKPAKNTMFDDSDDFLNELGFDPKHPKAGITKKSNILDDILNLSKPDPKSSSSVPTPTPKSAPSEADRRNSKPVETSPNRYSPSSIVRSRASRSGPAADPLGIFSSQTKQAETKKTESQVTTGRPKAARKSTIDWLGLDDENDDKTNVPLPTEPPRTKTETPQQQQLTNTIAPSAASTLPIPNESLPMQHPQIVGTSMPTATTDLTSNLNLIAVASLEKEQTLQSLQQQQTQLQFMSEMKQKESMLHEMLVKQQTLIKRQEDQFNTLLQRHINRQNQLEAQIQQRQEQINANLNVLMNQPSFGLATANIPISDETIAHSNDGQNHEPTEMQLHVIELEADVKRLELEKLRLEDTLQSIQASHEHEVDLLQTSHKKQIDLIEENLENQAKRLRDEIKSMETYYLNKIATMQTDMDSQQHKYQDHLEKLIGDYEKQIERIRLNYEHELEALQNDQRSTIENIRQVKLFEFAAMQESGSYLHTLKSASENLEHATDNLQSMRTNIDTTIERIHAEKEIHLEAKEKRLNEQQKSIENSMEKTEAERTRLIELVKSLEIKLNSVEQSATEEQWSQRQKAATLEAERVAFEREKTFTREKFAADEKRIQDLKEMHYAEHKRLMDLLDIEREQIIIEKTKLETMEYLKPASVPTTKRQSELNAAIKIAQDAAKSADAERGKFVEQQRQLELKKRELLETENKLHEQQSELELRISQAKDQKQVAEHAMKTCKALEQKLLLKLHSLQENYIELTDREAKLSQAKLELGKERVELQGARQQLRQSKCSLCRIDAQNREIAELDPLNDIAANDRPLQKFDIFSSNSFDGLQQRLINVESMIDDVIITIPQSQNRFHLNDRDSAQNAHSLPKIVIDPF